MATDQVARVEVGATGATAVHQFPLDTVVITVGSLSRVEHSILAGSMDGSFTQRADQQKQQVQVGMHL